MEVHPHLAGDELLRRIDGWARDGKAQFTSKWAAEALHLPFKYTSNLLGRLRRKGNIQADPSPRTVCGGHHRGRYYNYSLSKKGRKTLHYLNTRGSLPALQHLTRGIGKLDAEINLIASERIMKLIDEHFPSTPLRLMDGAPSKTDPGDLLTLVDPNLAYANVLRNAVAADYSRRDPKRRRTRLTGMALALQKRGYIPANIEVPSWVYSETTRGRADWEILLVLLFRGSQQLLAQREALTKSQQDTINAGAKGTRDTAQKQKVGPP